MKITGPTGIFGANRDYKTMIREPFANDLAHMFDEWTVPLIPPLLPLRILPFSVEENGQNIFIPPFFMRTEEGEMNNKY